MIGVEDLARAKKFYGAGLGCAIESDYPHFVSFNLGDGSSSLALYEREQPPKMPVSPPRDPDSGVSRSTSSSLRVRPWTKL
jgi:hypothetical protein